MSQLKTVSAKKLMGHVSGFALAVAGVALFSAAAQAGFEWTPPVKPLAAPAAQTDGALMPEMPAIPRDHVETIDMTAAVTAAPAAPVPAYVPSAPASPLLQPTPHIPSNPFPVAAPTDQAPRAPSRVPAPDTISSAPLATPTASSSSSAYEHAEGFGSDIPLALAMRQIVPAQYAYVFSGNVDQGTRISWNGGKPWNDVLADAIRPQGLDLSVSGQTVRVFPQGQAPVAAAPLSESHSPMLTGVAGDVSMASEPAREVYVRRNSSSGPVVAERAPGEPAVTSANTPVVLTADSATKKPKEKSGFWSHFGLDSSDTTTIRNEEKNVSQQGAAVDKSAYIPHTPATSEQGQLVAEMHDSQMYESQINEPLSLTSAPAPAEKISTAGNPYMMNSWRAEKGDSLRNVLQGWSDNAGVQLQWSAPADYVLPEQVRLQGSYTDALGEVLEAYDENGPRPLGRLHPNLPAGPSVLIIEASNS